MDPLPQLTRIEAQLETAVCFVAANVRDPILRSQFLDQACAGDGNLRATVEAMLREHVEAEVFFASGQTAVNAPEIDAPAAALLRNAFTDTSPEILADGLAGSWVGRYKLLQKIGEGGCGMVYLAEQEEPVRRQVALKVIKLGMDTRSVIARFEAERQALAMMDHPNIARVLDAGATDAGRPFFVMELVRGTRITKYCDENNLATAQRLALFIQTCRAIQHAHQKGIIHRDIKPSNILVAMHDHVPVPKVIDFGIAKATQGSLADNTVFTAVGQFVGTPAYISPEQAEISGMDVDTRSDIYSLGVLLYELLTGRTPFDGQTLVRLGMDEMRRKLHDEEPQLPSTMITSLSRTELRFTAARRQAEPPKLISQLKGDLDWIVMKALEKDRNRRYETANGLAVDIQRFLDGEPVMARPPTQFYRLQKLVCRNKIVFAAGTVVAVALLFGLGLSTWLFIRERESRQHESRLLADAEDRAKITQAVMLTSQGKYDEADALINEEKSFPSDPTMDRVLALRAVGEWMALKGRWKQAAERYGALLKIDRLSNPRLVAFDYQACGVVLAENGARETDEQFLKMAVAQFASAPIDSLLITCVLLPLNQDQVSELKPMADYFETNFLATPTNRISQWEFMPISLWKYRRGDYSEAGNWCARGLAQKTISPACNADLHLIRAMAEYRLGETDEARSELAQARPVVEGKLQSPLDRGRSESGYWFDWLYSGVLLQQAVTLTDHPSYRSGD